MKRIICRKKAISTASVLLIISVVIGLVWQYQNTVSVDASGIVSVEISQAQNYKSGDEMISERTENGKKYYMGQNAYALDISMGSIHYKDDYSDNDEQWKDIDLTFENNQITKAPYILTVENGNKSMTVYDKKTGKTATVKLNKIGDQKVESIKNLKNEPAIENKGKIQWNNVNTGLDLAVTAGNTRVSFDWVVKSEDAPHEVEFEINDGGIPVYCQGTDAEGNSVEVTLKKEGNKVTEKIEKGGKYPKTINPVIDVNTAASEDDCFMSYGGFWTLSLTNDSCPVGYCTQSYYKVGNGLRFQGITIPSDSLIVSSYLRFKAYNSSNRNGVKSKITGDKENNPAPWSTRANYVSRRGTVVGGADDSKITTTQVYWDNISAWQPSNWYDSPDISGVIQELIDSHAPNNEAMALFWDDHDNRSSTNSNIRGYSFDYGGASSAPKLYIEYSNFNTSNSPSSYSTGVVTPSSTVDTGLDYFSVTNNSGVAVNITVGGTDVTGGTTWTLSDNATPGFNTFGLLAGLSGDTYDIIIKKTPPLNTLKSNLAVGNSQTWGFQLLAPTNYSDSIQKSGTITLTASLP